MHLGHADTAVEAPPAVNAEPLLQPAARAVRLSRRVATMLAAGGRVGVIWLPVFALVSRSVDNLGTGLLLTTALTAVWWFGLRLAYASGRLTLFTLGASVAAAVGTSTGLVSAFALNAVVADMHFAPSTLFEMGAAVLIFSAAWEAIVQRSLAALQRVLIVGAGDGGSELVEDLALAGELPFELIGIVDDEIATDTIAGAPVHGRVADLPAIMEAQRPDLVVLAGGHNRTEAFTHLLDVAGSGFKVVGLPEFYEHVFGRVPVRHLTPVWFISILHLYQRPYTKAAKRTFDVVVAGVGLLLTAPLLPFLALLVRRTPGPVIFRQTRLGESGRQFTIFKFRTMRQDAEAPGRAIWAEELDPRITSIGRLMRKTRLDELPQLWNVLRGDMSVVGPRPERPEFLEQLQETVPFWTRRHLVKPGITGWAQVRRGYTADAEGTAEKLSYDLWYLRHRSLVVDLAISVKTFTTLATGSGAR